MAGALGRMADGQDREVSTVEGVGGICHLDQFGIELRWVLEGGIMLLSRLIRSTIAISGLFCGVGYETECCFD